jgi:hypothetical protein
MNAWLHPATQLRTALARSPHRRSGPGFAERENGIGSRRLL